MEDIMKLVFMELDEDILTFTNLENKNEAVEFFSEMKQRFIDICNKYDTSGYFKEINKNMTEAYNNNDLNSLIELKINLDANSNYSDSPHYSKIIKKIENLMDPYNDTLKKMTTLSEINEDLMGTINKCTISKYEDLRYRLDNYIDCI